MSEQNQSDSEITVFDRLVEAQDQELFHDGEVSPFTQAQIQAWREGSPLPGIDFSTPEWKARSAEILGECFGQDDLLSLDEIEDLMYWQMEERAG